MPFITQGKTNLKYILIVIILAAIVGGGVLVYQYWWAAKEETKPPEIKLPTDETAGLKTYRNEEYGFEVKYPLVYQVKKDFQPEEFYDHLVEFSNKETTFLVKAIYNIDIYKDKLPKIVAGREISDSPFKYTITELKIREYAVAITKLDDGDMGFIATIAHPTRNLFIEISLKGDYQEFNQMLSTFQFVETTEEFCGSSTYGSCSADLDCTAGGCSGQVCYSKNEEPIITTCEWRDCYDKTKYGVECKCIDNKCQWSK